jgi:hypothetical protein
MPYLRPGGLPYITIEVGEQFNQIQLRRPHSCPRMLAIENMRVLVSRLKMNGFFALTTDRLLQGVQKKTGAR